MPPPNHQTGSASGRCATKQRTFMCTVGAYGLRGWNTSDTPIASKPRPASSGRLAVADGGRVSPITCEKPTPPRSSTAPFSRMQVRPLPRRRSVGGLSHVSVTNVPPSSVPTAVVMRSCRSSR